MRYADALGCDVEIAFIPRGSTYEEEQIGNHVPGNLEFLAADDPESYPESAGG